MDSRPLPVETVSFTDRCAHRQIQSLAHLHSHTEGTKTRQAREKGRTSACKNHRCRRKTKTLLCAGPTHQQRGRVCSAFKNCVTTRTCGRPSVHVRFHCTDAIKHFPHAFARCVFELTSHLAGHVTTLYFVECGSICATTTDVVFHAKIFCALHAAVDVSFGHHGARTKNSRRRTVS